MSTIPKPTVGRIVLVTVADRTEREITIPAIVTHVHSPLCISVVAFSAFADAGVGPDGTKPMSSIEHGTGPNTWRWMDYQLGQAAKTEAVGGDLAKQMECHATVLTDMQKQINTLEAQLVALNQKQPASQRVPVADPSLQVDSNIGSVATLGASAAPVDTATEEQRAPLTPEAEADGSPAM